MKAVLLPAFGQGRLVPVFRLPCRMPEEVFEPALNIVRPWRAFLTFRTPWLTPCPECVRLRQACPCFPPAGAAYGPDSQKTDKHPAACNRLPSAGDTAKLSKKKKPARMSRSQSYSDAAKTYSAATTITLMSAKTPL